MSIQIDGVVSGLDTTSLINAIVAASGIPKQTTETRISEYQDKESKITDLISKLDAAKTALASLDESTDFDQYAATYTDNDAFSVELTSDAVKGSYDIGVNQLATNDMWVAAGVADTDTTTVNDMIGSGDTLTIAYNADGDSVDITVDSTWTLDDLKDAINSQVDGVSAYIMNDGSGTDPYRLVVQTESTGEDNYLTFSSTNGLDSFLSLDDAADTNYHVKTAQNAELTVNTVTVESASNTVTSAVTGMTLTLTDTTASDITVTVGDDADAIANTVQAFVDAFNEAATLVDTNSVYNVEVGIKGPFVGESSVRSATSGVLLSVTEDYANHADYSAVLAGNSYTAGYQLGIESDGNGKLTFDAATFKEALAADRADTLTFFTEAFAPAVTEKLDVYLDTTSGSLQVRKDSLESRITDLQEQVTKMDDRLTALETRLRAQFTAMEVNISSLQSGASFLTNLLGTTTTTS